MKRLDRSIRFIFFDLDNTLVHSDLAYAKACRAIQIDPEGDEFLTARRAVKSRLPTGHVVARNRLLYFKEYLSQKNMFSPGHLLQLTETYESAMVKDIEAQWHKLERQTLMESLKKRFCLSIVTNENTRTQLLKISAIDPMAKFFVDLTCSEEVGVEKPDPRIFHRALEKVGASPGESLFVGDSWLMDGEPACKLGMQVVISQEFIRDPVPEGLPIFQISNLNELEQLCQ